MSPLKKMLANILKEFVSNGLHGLWENNPKIKYIAANMIRKLILAFSPTFFFGVCMFDVIETADGDTQLGAPTAELLPELDKQSKLLQRRLFPDVGEQSDLPF